MFGRHLLTAFFVAVNLCVLLYITNLHIGVDTVIKLENITKTYGGKAQVHALKGINLTIQDGEIFGIIGKSGAGK